MIVKPGLVSCIIPVFNGERYINEAIDSVIAQSYRPVQIIVADDGSQDGTAAAVTSYGSQLTYLWRPNGGPPAARNLGLNAVEGEYVAFLDADDLWHPDKLTRQIARFHARPELDLCLTQAKMFWDPELAKEEELTQLEQRAVVVTACQLSTAVARRRLVEAIGPFKAELFLGDDTDWFERIAQRGVPIESLPDFLVYRRVHKQSITHGTNIFARDVLLGRAKLLIGQKRAKVAATDTSPDSNDPGSTPAGKTS